MLLDFKLHLVSGSCLVEPLSSGPQQGSYLILRKLSSVSRGANVVHVTPGEYIRSKPPSSYLIRAPLCQPNDAQNIPRIIRLDWDLDLAVKSFDEGPVVFDVCRACF